MRRRFVFGPILVAMLLIAACSSDDTSTSPSFDQSEVPTMLDHPIVVGLDQIDQPKDTVDDMKGSIKVSFPRPTIGIESVNCEGDVHVYHLAYGVNIEVESEGKIHTSIGLRAGDGDYTRYSGLSSEEMRLDQTLLVTTAVIAVPKDTDVHVQLVVVGGDENSDHSSQHYDQFTPEDDIPVITSTQCLMNT